MNRTLRSLASLAIAATITLCGAPGLAADIVTRTPNINSVVLPKPGTVDFLFNHRVMGFDVNQLAAVPTFGLEAGVFPWLSLYGTYSTKGYGVYPLERAKDTMVEKHDLAFGLRQNVFNQEAGAPFSLTFAEGVSAIGVATDSLQPGGLSSRSMQGGLAATIGRTFGPLGLVGTAKAVGWRYFVLNNGKDLYNTPGFRASGTLGATLAITPYISLAGDFGKYFDNPAGIPAWSAALQGQIPFSPHLVALEVTNVPTSTLTGSNEVLQKFDAYYVGFAFSVAFSGLNRWQKMFTPTWLTAKPAPEPEEEAPPAPAAEPAPPPAAAPPPVAEVPAPRAPTPAPAASPTPPAAVATLAPPAAPDPALIAKGKKLYDETAADMGCAACHGAGGKGDSAPGIRGKTEAQLRAAFKPGGSMEDFRKLRDADLKAIAAYLKSVK